jgi:hypothetical protein
VKGGPSDNFLAVDVHPNPAEYFTVDNVDDTDG